MVRVSVVIAAYESEAFLGAALDSVLALEPWPASEGAGPASGLELVVVDDGSATRAAQSLVEAAAERAPFPVRYHYQTNGGPSAARNTGLRLSEGDLVAFLDADDVFLPGKLALQVPLLDAAGVGTAFVCGGHTVVEPAAASRPRASAQPGHTARPSTLVEPPPVQGDLYGALVRDELQLLGTAAFLHRRSALEAVGGYDESLRNNEDLDLTLRLARAFPICVHPEPVFENRLRAGSLSSAAPARALEQSLAFLDKLEREDPELAPALLSRKRQRAYFNAARKHLRQEGDFEAFRSTFDEGVRRCGRPGTWRGWAAWALARSGPLGRQVARRARRST